MQVLLLRDVEGLGLAGDIKDVPGGYAKNFLIPRKLATAATAGAARQAKDLQDAAARRQDRKLTEAKAQAAKLDGKVITFQVRAGEDDKLYGSVTSPEIAEQLSRVAGFEIDRKNIALEHAIKSLGEHEVQVKLGSGVNATVQVNVERAAEE
jgi:large subunit ribosomal protein L9